jgi:hypothetical protein
VGFAILLTAPAHVVAAIQAVAPAALFLAIPLVALQPAFGDEVGCLLPSRRTRSAGPSLLFGDPTLAASLAVALVSRLFAPLKTIRAGEVPANAEGLHGTPFPGSIFRQRVGEGA